MPSSSPQNLAQLHSVKKLNQLLQAVQEAKKKIESFAAGIKNTQLHQAIISMALENNQYAIEIKSLILSLGGETETKPQGATGQPKKKITEKNVLSACEKSERLLVKIYKEVLNESYVYDSLKKIIGYQLKGVTFAFQKLKLLNTLQR
ncbi:MAG: DUF2383 domain-containing protein [Bacteroidetes bacterium]|nr:DUF2383 domain-containing protein [Bacteroidota bacterium]MBS1973305.1 DUF2383 domain-containing protein [Bacteroidota bacterium]